MEVPMVRMNIYHADESVVLGTTDRDGNFSIDLPEASGTS
jgi:hypothetical protein